MKIEKTFLKTNYTHQELISIFEKINFKLLKLIEFSKMDILPASKLIKHHDALIKALLNTLSTSQSAQIKTFCEENIRLVIMHLQIQDIMSQAFDHMQQINNNIILELMKAESDSKSDCLSDTKYMCVIPEITRMNKEQLSLMGNEYSKTTSTVAFILESLETEIKRISNHDIELIIHFPNISFFNIELDDILVELNQLEEKVSVENTDIKNTTTRLLDIATIFTMESERKTLNKILYGKEFSKKGNNADDEIELF